MFLIILVAVAYMIKRSMEDEQYQAPEARDFIASGRHGARAAAEGEVAWPSGRWRGYYHQFGHRHMLCDFTLSFHAQRVSGSGVDDVGGYEITGICGGGRVAFRKQYMRGSRAVSGLVNSHMNKGHSVEYRGKMVGRSLGQGVRGEWFISSSSSGYRGSGQFHLWPGMANWQQFDHPSAPVARASDEEVPPTPRLTITQPAPVQFHVTEDNVCTVCFERAINTCLQPCNHVAVCRTCAGQLGRRLCPICGSPVTSIVNCDGVDWQQFNPSAPMLEHAEALASPLVVPVQ